MRGVRAWAGVVGVLFTGCAASQPVAQQAARPNVLILIADDLGFGDIGAYGAEVATPNIDRLAAEGVQLTNFHTAATCSPSRAMLLTGVDNHRNGLGSMGEFLTPNQVGAPGYEGFLNDRVFTLAEWVASAGYHSVFSGKWHLGMQPTQWPSARGFARSFALLDGSADNWSDVGPAPILPVATFTRNGERIERPTGFSSALFVDELLAGLDAKPRAAQPFLAVLSFQAVHWPHHAPQDLLDKYAHRYDVGWDVVRAARHARLRERGLLPADAPERPRDPSVPAWDTLSSERRQRESRRMAAYAAMTEDMDREIGRVLRHLEERGSLRDTIVVFVSDNGPDPSEPNLSPRALAWYSDRYPRKAADELGGPGSFPSYGPQWAQLGAVHLRSYKGSPAEGGMRVPFIVRAPGRIQSGGRSDAFAFATDLVPTLLELIGVAADPQAAGRHGVDGVSMLPVLRGERDRVHEADAVIGYELMVGRALFQGNHKLVNASAPSGDGTWKLFDIARDSSELEDLRKREPETFSRLMRHYERYVADYGVIPMAADFDIFEALTSERPKQGEH